MSRHAKIRVVGADERAEAPAEPLTLQQAVEIGDHYLILIAQRRELAAAIPDERGPAKAALHRQLGLVSKEISQIEAARKEAAEQDARATPDDSFDASAV